MRQALQQNATRARIAETTSVPAAVGGWNARDPLAAMKPIDAVTLDNWYPTAADCLVRFGSANHVTGITGQVESLLVYSAGTANKMFAAAGTAIYEVTAAGAVGAAVVLSLTNARWQDINLRTAGGAYLYAFNGADKPRLYNGSTWVAVDAASTPAITGITTTTLIHPNIWKRRIFLVQKDTMSVWYLPADSIGGTASEINFGPLFRKGGSVLATATYTLDGGEGMDDHLVIITTKGEVAVYKGTDPAAAATFGLVGIYQVGTPIGRRCFVKVGGDLCIITSDGAMPLAEALAASRAKPAIALTDKIRDAFTAAAQQYGTFFGWEGIYFPAVSFILFNIPTQEGANQHQYVMNSFTKSWCRFTGWKANCWAVLNDLLYFGSNGAVLRAWTTQSDNGANINTDVKQAFHYFGSRGETKCWSMCRPIFSANGNIGPAIDLNIDFEDREPTSLPTFSTLTASLWDSAVWDTAVWGGGLSLINDWLTVSGEGYCAALRMKVATNALAIHWTATDYVLTKGRYL